MLVSSFCELFADFDNYLNITKIMNTFSIKDSMGKAYLRGDLFVCHVTGARKHNLLCFAVGRPIKKYGLCVMFKIRLKLKDFGCYAKEKMMPEI